VKAITSTQKALIAKKTDDSEGGREGREKATIRGVSSHSQEGEGAPGRDATIHGRGDEPKGEKHIIGKGGNGEQDGVGWLTEPSLVLVQRVAEMRSTVNQRRSRMGGSKWLASRKSIRRRKKKGFREKKDAQERGPVEAGGSGTSPPT